ncbi:hypothetical protein ACFXPQ_03055 [Streptomyces lydicus]|uniref:hypothetical protein n=1 Tax=Streptomyces lydicus TaxID=47763 RepID=UPI00368328CA
MPTIMEPLTSTERNSAPSRKTTPYENWRPPVIGVSLLVPVGPDAVVVADLLGSITLPTGLVQDGQTPEQAAQDLLRGGQGELPILRRVALAWQQTRRRKVITHVLATAPLTRAAVGHLTYRDPRADVRVLPTMRLLKDLNEVGKLRALVALQALATGEMAYIEGGVVHPSAPQNLTQST